MTEYAFDNAVPAQRERRRTLEALQDAGTTALLEPRVLPDADCLEVGAGGGSIALWLCERTRSVVATDLDFMHLRELARPNLTVREHDLLRNDLPAAAFDLITCRSCSRGSGTVRRRCGRAGGWSRKRWTSSPPRPTRGWPRPTRTCSRAPSPRTTARCTR